MMIIMIMMIMMMTVKSILYRWTLLDQGELETQEEEVGFIHSHHNSITTMSYSPYHSQLLRHTISPYHQIKVTQMGHTKRAIMNNVH